MRIAVLALLAVSLACGAPEPQRAPPRHLVLVTVDTLRADRLGVYGNPLELTPHLDALAKQSIVFRHAFAPAPFTLPSLSALLTGRYPDAIGVRSNGRCSRPRSSRSPNVFERSDSEPAPW